MARVPPCPSPRFLKTTYASIFLGDLTRATQGDRAAFGSGLLQPYGVFFAETEDLARLAGGEGGLWVSQFFIIKADRSGRDELFAKFAV